TNDKGKHWHWDLFDVYPLKNVQSSYPQYAFAVMRHMTKALGNSHFAKIIAQEEKSIRSQFFDFRLTAREKEVLLLIGKAKTDKEIADELMLSPLTIATHRRNLLKKLNARNKNELIKMVHENMLI
ncbi:MAG: LuxR C-terminal-related transcriptional regulator, partial [Bacteroidota bacterium]